MEKLKSLKELIKQSVVQILRNDLLGFMIKGNLLLMLVSILFFIPLAIPFFSLMSKMSNFESSLETSLLPEGEMEKPLPTMAPNSFEVVMIIAGILFLLSFLYVSVNFSILLALKIADGTTQPLKPLLINAFKRAPDMFVHLFLKGLLLFVGYLLFIVPGVILTVMFLFSETVLINEDLKPIQAFKRSKELTKGFKWKIYLKIVGLFGLQLLLLIPFVLFAAIFGNKSVGPVFIQIYAVVIQLIFINLYKDVVRVKSSASAALPTEAEVTPAI